MVYTVLISFNLELLSQLHGHHSRSSWWLLFCLMIISCSYVCSCLASHNFTMYQLSSLAIEKWWAWFPRCVELEFYFFFFFYMELKSAKYSTQDNSNSQSVAKYHCSCHLWSINQNQTMALCDNNFSGVLTNSIELSYPALFSNGLQTFQNG